MDDLKLLEQCFIDAQTYLDEMNECGTLEQRYHAAMYVSSIKDKIAHIVSERLLDVNDQVNSSEFKPVEIEGDTDTTELHVTHQAKLHF